MRCLKTRRSSTPVETHFHPVIGRPSTPIECYLRVMFLKGDIPGHHPDLTARVQEPTG